jgi:hypothetical protein
MPNNLLSSKIELLEEQIENLERSGFFTEAEIDHASSSLRAELARLKLAHSHIELGEKASKAIVSIQRLGQSLYGMTSENYAEGIRYHNECFAQMKNFNSTKLPTAKLSNEL